jgi:2-methylfumaryl-CoA isomerase
LIHVHIDGHRDGRPAVDYTVNAEVGLPLITGPENAAGPVNHVLPAWDMVAGMSATTALLAAVWHRDRTGTGAKVNIALADVALSWVANFGWLSEAQQLATDRGHQGNYLYGSYGRDFATSDGRHVMVVALTPHQWRSLVAVTGSQQEIEAIEHRHGIDLSIEDARYEHREEISEAMAGWFAGLDSGVVAQRLTAARVLWAPYRTLREAADAGDGPLRPISQPGIGTVISAESPMRWDGVDPLVSPASRLGADTYTALAELAGVTDAEFAELVDAGVIAAQDSFDG